MTAKSACAALLIGVVWAPQAAAAPIEPRMETVFAERRETALVLEIEGALALAQAEHGLIPQTAALAICAAADPALVTPDAFDAEYDLVRHRMVAMLNVWRRGLPEHARDWVHYGATTVDIYDTAAILQTREAAFLLLERLVNIEAALIAEAERHRDTPMIGRTLGQHALPITWGKKLGGHIAETQRHSDRLAELIARLDRSAILKGAVGSYYGLGPDGIGTEQAFARYLGLAEPYPDDWHAARDVFAEYAALLSLIALSWERFGQEIFLLQGTDIAEVAETRPAGAVSSSAMPHKSNPSLSEALIHHGRVVPRLADIVIDDMVSFFERDNTSRSNAALGDLSIAAAGMLDDAARLIGRIEADPVAMRRNLDRTGGQIMSQRVVFALAPTLGRIDAEERVRTAAFAGPDGFRDALLADPEIAARLTPDALDALLDPTADLGLAGPQLDRVIAEARARRAPLDRAIRRSACPGAPS